MTPQPNPAGRTRRNVDELRQLLRDCGWRISSSIGYIDTWRLIGSPDETLSIPTSREADRFDERYDAAVARLTPEPSAPPVVSRHVSLAQELLVAAVGRQNAETARNMCHWVQGVGNAREESHEAFHYGNVCPYEAVAAVLSGQPDPRDSDFEYPVAGHPVDPDDDPFTVEPARLAGITGELAEHSAALDHALDHDGAGHWFCKTCDTSSPQPTLAERRIAAVLEAVEVGRGHGCTTFDLTNLTRMLTEDYPSVSD